MVNMGMPPEGRDIDQTLDENLALTGPVPTRRGRGQPADEADGSRIVLAEWALWGKDGTDPGYRVLRCSKGTFDMEDFYAIIARYASGAKEALPQYTVCWIPDEKGREGYLAVAIHEQADPDPRLSGGRVRTAKGRVIEYIRMFCVPYRELARYQATYAELVDAVKGQQLPAGPSDKILVALPDTAAPAFPPQVCAFAKNVATLLLTTRPVCVLGAERATAEERLWFIDLVMSLLPYGLRTTLSASTWASPTASQVKLRLFFSSARRDDDGGTSHVAWGQPARLALGAPELQPLRHYVSWLEHVGSTAPLALATQTDPVRFSPAAIRQMVANLPSGRPLRDVLEELADGARRGDQPVVKAAVDRLRRYLKSPQDPGERVQARRLVTELGLLRDHDKLRYNSRASVYRVLLRLAFESRISYAAYCEIEDCAGGPPRGALRGAMLELTFNSYLPWLLTTTSEEGLSDRQVMASLHDQHVSATSPVTEFERSAHKIRPAHRAAGFDLAVGYLIAEAADPRAELARRGYLATTLEATFPGDLPAQRDRLAGMLRFAYGGPLSKPAVAALDAQRDLQRTRAFDAAVARLSRSRGAGWLRGTPARAWAFLSRLLTGGGASRSARGVIIGLAVVVLAVIAVIAILIVRSLYG
jgi:hypothetical protein